MATQINPYLCFNGNCEEAFAYYKSIFGGEFAGLSRFKDAPAGSGPPIDEKFGNLIMNMSLPISGNNILMGSDGHPAFPKVPFGKNLTLSVSADTKELADRFFKMLADSGQAHMPMADMFWGSYFGMCEDKFGMNWMVSFVPPAN